MEWNSMESKFTGSLLGIVINSILQIFITVLTLGLGLSWAVCIKEKVDCSFLETILNGGFSVLLHLIFIVSG